MTCRAFNCYIWYSWSEIRSIQSIGVFYACPPQRKVDLISYRPSCFSFFAATFLPFCLARPLVRYVCFFVRSVYYIGFFVVRSFVRLFYTYIHTYIITYRPNYQQANKPIDQTIFFSCLGVLNDCIAPPTYKHLNFIKINLALQIELTI